MKIKLFFLVTLLAIGGSAFGQSWSGQSSSDARVVPPYKLCVGSDNGQDVCVVLNASNVAKITNGALDFAMVSKTVATLPSAATNTGRVYRVTDGTSATDCTTGSGSTSSVCYSNGVAWTALGGGFSPNGDLAGSGASQQVVGLHFGALNAVTLANSSATGCLNNIAGVITPTGNPCGNSTPASPEASIQLNHSSAFSAVSNFGIDSVPSPTTFINGYILSQQADSIFKGPNPGIDIRSYGAFSSIAAATTGTGSGTSLTVGSANWPVLVNGTQPGISIVGAGAAPAIAAPTGLTIATGASSGPTTVDVQTISGMTGSSTYNYCVFGMDVLGGVTVCSSTATITNGPTALGNTSFTVSTWSLTGNTLTIVTSTTSGLPVGTWVHITGTSNNALAGGWYPVATSSGTTLTFTNVPQYSLLTTSGTGGTLASFVSNQLTWTASTGGVGSSFTTPWEYGICAQRPGDSSFHLVGFSFPTTFYTSGGYVSTTFNDFGSTLTANPLIPWWLAGDANCTAGSPQNEVFTTTVASGGGTTSLTLASSMTNAVTGATVRVDNAPALISAFTAAATSGTPVYIPNGFFQIGSFTHLPVNVKIEQAGTLQFTATTLVPGSTTWNGRPGMNGALQFGFNGAPLIQCYIAPCIWVAGTSSGASGGGTRFDELFIQTTTANGLDVLVDGNWGTDFYNVNMQSGSGNTDNMGIALMARPGASNYTLTNVDISGGPNQNIDQTWAPLVYLDKPTAGCCGGSLSVGSVTTNNLQLNRRGIYFAAVGGPGISISMTGRTYRQGGITPILVAHNTNGVINGQIQMDVVAHDTESQAAFAWICNISCSLGTASPPVRIGFINQISQDAGTVPQQVTGSGPITVLVAGFSPGGLQFGNSSPQWTYQQNRLSSNTGIQLTNSADFLTVPTPTLILENGSSTYTLTANITANRVGQMPDAPGVVCVTGMLGCDYSLDTGVANAYAICPSPIPVPSLVIGQHFTWQASVENTGASTLNVCSFGAKTIKKNSGTGGSVGSDLVAHDIKIGQIVEVAWDGFNMQMLSQLGNGGGGTGTVATTGSPANNNLSCFSGTVTITNCNLSGDVTTSGSSATTVNAIQGTTVSTSSVQTGQILTVDATPKYTNKYPGVNYNPQTTTYSIACPGDRLGYVDFTGSSATTFTLAQANSTACLGSSASYFVHNGGTAALTLAATTSTIDGITGATGVQILPGEARLIYEDPGSPNNYHTTHVRSAYGGINTQTANYTAIASDFGKIVLMNCASSCTFTLPATPPITGETAAGSRWNVRVLSIGASLAAISLNSLNFNGSASVPILQKYVEQEFSTDGSNYFGSAPIVCSTNMTCTPAPQGLSLSSSGGGGSVTGSINQVVTCIGTNNCVGNANIQTDSNNDLQAAGTGQFGSAASTHLTWCDGGIPGLSCIAAEESTGPTDTTSGIERHFASTTQHDWRFQINNADFVGVRGNLCTNVTPVTVSTNTTSDQNLMACTLAAGDLNTTLRTLNVKIRGVYTTPAASSATVTLKVKFCTVSGCGSGTVITPLNITSGANPGTVTNNPADLRGDITTQTAGASAAFEAHGAMVIDLGATTTAASTVYADTNTSTVGTIDSTGQIFLQTTVAFSAASASNSYTARQLIVDLEN